MSERVAATGSASATVPVGPSSTRILSEPALPFAIRFLGVQLSAHAANRFRYEFKAGGRTLFRTVAHGESPWIHLGGIADAGGEVYCDVVLLDGAASEVTIVFTYDFVLAEAFLAGVMPF